MAGLDLAAWYAAESPSVRRYLLALSLDPALAEDLTQETFVQAIHSLAAYRGGSARAYLFTIARRVYARHIRRELRRRRAEENSAAPGGAELAPFQDAGSLLPGLSAEDRALVAGRAIAGRPFAEIARELGRTENWARVRYFRLLARLRADAAEGGAGDGGAGTDLRGD